MKFTIAFLTPVLLFVSCLRSDECDPNKICNTVRPDSSWVNIQFSYSEYNIPVPFTLYNGTVENELVVLRDTAYSDQLSYYLPIQERYSIKAVYTVNGVSVTAYDGGKLRLEKSWNCDERCYDAPDLDLDVSLIQ